MKRLQTQKDTGTSYLEKVFFRIIQINSIPIPKREYKFHQFRFDYAWPSLLLAVELDGSQHYKYRQQYQSDCRKNNIAVSEGWAIIRADREIMTEAAFIKILKTTISRRIIGKHG